MPQFYFFLDSGHKKVNDGSGSLLYDNVPVGSHQVSEVVPDDWDALSVTPANGTVDVPGGDTCVNVTFKNRQKLPGSSASSSSSESSRSSSSSSSSSTAATGCIEVKKDAFDTQNNPLSPVPQFTFTLDGTVEARNDGSGLARFTNVPAGTHAVVETLPPTWELVSVAPSSGSVLVQGGDQCTEVRFRNKQVITSSSSSSSSVSSSSSSTSSSSSSSSSSSQPPIIIIERRCDECQPKKERGSHRHGIDIIKIIAQSRLAKKEKEPVELVIDKSSDRGEVQGGDVYTYTISVRNISKRTAMNVAVNDYFDQQRLIVLDTDGGQLTYEGIRWVIPSVKASELVTFRYHVRLTQNVQHGDLVHNTSIVRAEEAPERIAYNDVRVIKVMPQTGTYAMAESAAAYLRPLQSGTSAGTIPLTVLLTFMTLGTAVGGTITKRWL
ncbi:MAG: hypothetical protein AAB728_02370 [Patescibacteria group bacterium]